MSSNQQTNAPPEKAATKNWLDDESDGDSDNEEFGLERTEASVSQAKVDSAQRAKQSNNSNQGKQDFHRDYIANKILIEGPVAKKDTQKEEPTHQDQPEVEAAAKLQAQGNGQPERR